MPECRVLVVEDEDDLRDVMSLALEASGHEVLQAANGIEALDVLRREFAPDVIVLDLMMPVMSGWELLRALRDDPELSRIPVVLATASVDDLPDDVKFVLRKPFSEHELSAAVEDCCSSLSH